MFLVNTSLDATASGRVISPSAGFERWNPETGEIQRFSLVRQTRDGNVLHASAVRQLVVVPYLIAVVVRNAGRVASGSNAGGQSRYGLAQVVNWKYTPGANVLTLDYVDVTSRRRKEERYLLLSSPAVDLSERVVWLPIRGIEAIQFSDELIRHKFPVDSGFTATYRFTIEKQVPKPLWIVIERPDLYTITCNGQPATAAPGQWWLDRSFGKVEISAAAGWRKCSNDPCSPDDNLPRVWNRPTCSAILP